MIKRLFAVSISLAFLITTPAPSAYAAAVHIARVASGKPISGVAGAWTQPIDLMAVTWMSQVNNPLAASLSPVLSQIRFQLHARPDATETVLTFVRHLPAQMQAQSSKFFQLSAQDQADALSSAISLAGQALNEEALQLTRKKETLGLNKSDIARIRQLAAVPFYLENSTAEEIRSIHSQETARKTQGMMGAVARALLGRQKNSSDAAPSVSGEFQLLMSGAESLVSLEAYRLAHAPSESPKASKDRIVRDVLMPFAKKALDDSEARLANGSVAENRLSLSILGAHRQLFGAAGNHAFIKVMRKTGMWNDFVAGLSMLAADRIAETSSQSIRSEMLPKIAANDELAVGLPAWRPESQRHQTVQDVLIDRYGREKPSEEPGMSIGPTIPLGRMLGVKVSTDLSLLAIVGFIAQGLAGTLLPEMAPGLSYETYLALGVISGLGLFGSVLAHEFGHALAGRYYGIRTRAIHLFALGGVASMERIPRHAGQEFVIASAGPAVSLALGVAGMAAAQFLTLPVALLPVIFYVGAINLVLFAFNVFIPAFPMDGGRMLRAFLAAVSGNHYFASRTAGRIGVLFSYLFLAWAVMDFANGGLMSALMKYALSLFISGQARAEGMMHPGTDLVEK